MHPFASLMSSGASGQADSSYIVYESARRRKFSPVIQLFASSPPSAVSAPAIRYVSLDMSCHYFYFHLLSIPSVVNET